MVASAALIGSLILVFLVAVALQPPAWVQVLLGIGLAIGGAVLAWLIASALGQSRAREEAGRAVHEQEPPPIGSGGTPGG